MYCELDEKLFRTIPKAQNGGKKPYIHNLHMDRRFSAVFEKPT
jgi:hypothetical protein